MKSENGKRAFTWIGNNKKWLYHSIEIVMVSLLFVTFTGCMGSTADASKDVNNVEVSSNADENISENTSLDDFDEVSSKEEAVVSEESLQKEEEAEKNQSAESKLVIEVDGERIYPTDSELEDMLETGDWDIPRYVPLYPSSMKDERKVGEWVYFRYELKETYNNYESIYPVLFRYREEESVAERVNDMACYTFDVVGDYVYYMDSSTGFQDHGVLYVMKSDGQEKRKLVDELFDFQIVDDQYIYFTYRHDTLGVGLEGHALHRMNLDGSDIMIAAYEVSGADFGISHFDYKVVDGWVDCGTFKMELGEPADGYEKLVFNDIGDNDWVYYVTNRLMKARKDGSERTELDGEDDYHYTVEKIEDDWIYYIKGGEKYKIRTDGSGKEAIKPE